MKDILGFSYTPSLFANVKSKRDIFTACARFSQRFPEYIWNDSVNEGKAYTYPLVKTILEGVTHGGSKLSEKTDIMNQKRSLEKLISLVKSGEFDINKGSFCSLHNIAAKEEALSWGVFRTGSVSIAGSNFMPPSSSELDSIFLKGMSYIKAIDNTIERSMVFFLFGSLHQFFYDVNKRTSRLMMNGVLMAGGYDALVIDARLRHQYNKSILELYNDKNGDSAIKFLIDCYKAQDAIKLNMETK